MPALAQLPGFIHQISLNWTIWLKYVENSSKFSFYTYKPVGEETRGNELWTASIRIQSIWEGMFPVLINQMCKAGKPTYINFKNSSVDRNDRGTHGVILACLKWACFILPLSHRKTCNHSKRRGHLSAARSRRVQTPSAFNWAGGAERAKAIVRTSSGCRQRSECSSKKRWLTETTPQGRR